MSDREVCEHFKRIQDPCDECGGGVLKQDTTTAEDRGIAARIWCEPRHTKKVMDTDLAESIACCITKARQEGYVQGRKDALESELNTTTQIEVDGLVYNQSQIRRFIQRLLELEGKEK